MTAYTRAMSNHSSRPAAPSAPTSPYLDPSSIYHPARLARALGALLGLLLGAALLTGGLGHPLTINGLVAPLDGMPATSPERTAEELDRDVASHRPADAHRSPSAPARPLVPAADTTLPQDLLLPEDAVSPAPLAPAVPEPAVTEASAAPDQTDAYSTFAQAREVAHPAAAVNLPAAVRDADTVRAGRPATFPDGTPLPPHRPALGAA